MTLFKSESQYRETAAIWRIFSLLPLYGRLSNGRMFRWFAMNIPMDLGTGGTFTSDIDIIALLSNYPHSREWIAKTWEVKISLLCKDGSVRSLKAGKIERTIKQLTAYRGFGSPDVSLLDVYVCEAGFSGSNNFPPQSFDTSLHAKLPELRRHGFGYQQLPFEHGKDLDTDVGLLAFSHQLNPFRTTFGILPAIPSQSRDGFSRLVDRIDTFFKKAPDRDKYFNCQVIFCKRCRQLQLIRMKDEQVCPTCGSNLVA